MDAVEVFMAGPRILPFLLLLMACASDPSSASRLERVPSGPWGGQHVRLAVDDTGATIDFDCAHGRLEEPLVLDEQGAFDVKGNLVREGGPTPPDDTEKAQAARYKGTIDGDRMSLALVLSDGQTGGSFTLTKGAVSRLFKCL
jgi:hypothetical protein